METINLANFLAYFGDYYPILIPSIALLLLLSGIMLDQLRVWVITYVDEGENGPYKTYIIPLLCKLYGVTPDLDASGLYTSSFGRGQSTPHCTKLPISGTYLYAYDKEPFGRAMAYLKSYGEEKLLYQLKETNAGPFLCTVLSFMVALLGLLAYKFLPALTVGAIVAYAVMRLARSILRLTKRFNKHIGDGHGVKEIE